jgi:hypothetical protein
VDAGATGAPEVSVWPSAGAASDRRSVISSPPRS